MCANMNRADTVTGRPVSNVAAGSGYHSTSFLAQPLNGDESHASHNIAEAVYQLLAFSRLSIYSLCRAVLT